MTRTKFAFVAAALIGASAVVMADEPRSDAARQQRMDDALQNYRSNGDHRTSSAPGTFERAENSVKHGAHKTGEAIEHGAHKTGEAIEHATRKTGT
jgi:hypothetical protein